ncbi:MAG: hypothetical protein PQJ46_06120 [Spirochaetales bacterium]|nr:hypothetical protein [Spirochaetales bacterium]
MNDKKITIFHITRKDGTPLFLYPFNKKSNLIELFEKSSIVGLYGDEPRVESLTLLRNELYRLVEDSVKEWIAEKKFIPRFLISSAVFLIVYFLMSFIIRDPLPMVDELVGGIVSAVICYFFLMKRDRDSKKSTEMKIKLRKKVDEIVFNEDVFTKDVEQYFQYCETSEDIEELFQNILKDKSGCMFDYSDKEKVSELLESISLMFNEGDIKKYEKLLYKINSSESSTSGKNRLIKWLSSRKVDPALFALYAKITKEK